jgi:hypothetical protein
VRLLPAVSDHAEDWRWTLQDLGNGAITLVTPSRVSSLTYTITGGPCGAGTLSASGAYTHDAARYPGEVAPVDGTGNLLPGGFDLVWLPGTAAGQPNPGVTECDLPAYLRTQPGGYLPATDVPITLTVTQQVEFTIAFAASVPVTDGQATGCPLVAVPPPAESSPPEMAFSTGGYLPANGACPGGDVGIAAVERALTANRVTGVGFDSLTVVPAVGGAPYTLTNGGLTMHVTYQARRTVVLRYHLVQLREVPPP